MPVDQIDAVSPFETLRAYGGKIFRLEEHAQRLDESCRAIGRIPPPIPELTGWLRESLAESGFKDALLRVSGHGDALVVIVRPFSGHPPALYENGVELRTAVSRRPSPRAADARIKASQFVTGVLAQIDAGSHGQAHELIFFGPDGTVAEGTVSNIFIVKQKTLLTPPVSSGILRGVTRDVVLSSARGLGARETPLTRHEIYTADECFMTNTSSEVLPVVRVDARTIGAGKPGPVTRAVAKKFKETVRRELGL